MNVQKSYGDIALLFITVMPIACSKTARLAVLAAEATRLAFGDNPTAGTGTNDADYTEHFTNAERPP